MGVEEERILVTGASRFDMHYSRKERGLISKDERKKILIIMNDIWNKEGVVTHHIGLNVFFDHMTEFIRFAKNNQDIDVIVRPHDGHHSWNELLADDLKDVTNMIISRKGSLEELLAEVDLVVGYPSTALIEALIQRVPVISIDTGSFYNYLPLWKYGLSTRISDFSELAEKARPLLYDEGKRAAAVKDIDRGLGYFNYGDDGMATPRIAGEISRIMNVNGQGA
jgi:hypothetical protein